MFDWISLIIGMWIGAGIFALGLFSKEIKNLWIKVIENE